MARRWTRVNRMPFSAWACGSDGADVGAVRCGVEEEEAERCEREVGRADGWRYFALLMTEVLIVVLLSQVNNSSVIRRLGMNKLTLAPLFAWPWMPVTASGWQEQRRHRQYLLASSSQPAA
jgi:hypothetical protein